VEAHPDGNVLVFFFTPKVIVDPKVVTAFTDTHVAQMLGYLNITGLEVALLVSFKESTLAWKRIVHGRPPTEAS